MISSEDKTKDPDSNLYEWEKPDVKIPDSVREEIAMFEKEREDLQIRLDEALTLVDDKIDAIQELQIKYEDLMRQYQELLEVERLRTSKSDFKSAAVLPRHAWIAAIDALNFYSVLNKASRWAIEHNDPWHKILFDIKEDGQLKAAELEK